MRSLRLRIAVSVIAVAVLLVGALATLLYVRVSQRIREDFDRRLVADARMLTELVEMDHEDGLELELAPMLDRPGAPACWRVWARDGTVLAGDGTTPSGWDAARHSEPVFAALELDGETLRAVSWSFVPRVDDEASSAHAATVPTLVVGLARSTVEVDALLDELARTFWLLGTLTCLLVGGVATWQVGRGVAPVRRLATKLARAGPGDHAGGLDVADLPSELVPFVARLNSLLERLQGALTREREFTGHVAHELRTPLSVLRTGLDLARRKHEPASDTARRLLELTETVDEMAGMVDDLLLLARVEAGHEPAAPESVRISPLVRGEWSTLESRAASRDLAFEDSIPPDLEIEGDARYLQIVVRNLLGNAVSYTEQGGRIVVEARSGELLSVWDSGPQLHPDQLERLFDRMWRADEARTDAVLHAGLGLSLARALCRQMRMELSVANEEDGGLRFSIRRSLA